MKVRSIAFFDVDETLINVKSMFSFRSFYFRRLWGETHGRAAEAAAAARIDDHVRQGADRTAINMLFFKDFGGHREQHVIEAANAWYAQERLRPGFFIEPVLRLLRGHQRAGEAIAFVTGSALDFVQPLAAELGVSHVLANRLESIDGIFTGTLKPPQTIGLGKKQAARSLVAKLGVDFADCYGYGDHISDAPLLECVGHPTVVARDPALLRHAEKLGWPVLHPTESAN